MCPVQITTTPTLNEKGFGPETPPKDLHEITLEELLDPSSKAEHIFSKLTQEQLTAIEKNLNRVKKKKMSSLKHPIKGFRTDKKTRKTRSIGGYKRNVAPSRKIESENNNNNMIDSIQQLQQQDAFLENISSGYDFNFGAMQEQQPLPIHHITNALTSPILQGMNGFIADQQQNISQLDNEHHPHHQQESVPFLISTQSEQQHHKANHQTYQFIASKPNEIFIESPPVYLENQSNNNEATASWNSMDVIQLFASSYNCVYPRAFCSPELYKGNRWVYETQCNVLGWMLAYLNPEEMSGKRGLIQRAVDTFRNLQPGSKSRRVARQEKVLNGTLRKRKSSRPENEPRPTKRKYTNNQKPKTLIVDNVVKGVKCRIKINVEDVNLNDIDIMFKKNNCVFPRAFCDQEHYVGRRYYEEVACNELAWKLAWLNPRHLANKKCLLQRAVDIYRTKFTENLKPRIFDNSPSSANYQTRLPFLSIPDNSLFTSSGNNLMPATPCSLDSSVCETPISCSDISTPITLNESLLDTKVYIANQQLSCFEGLFLDPNALQDMEQQQKQADDDNGGEFDSNLLADSSLVDLINSEIDGNMPFWQECELFV
ncbi:3399_t:CDS:2 [Ambispora gerdemannii]|uniref:3399_t:CDS:1 n=1 Tax=Ambispora gerdemannii TaxID=144530 RepID=A0A9N8VH99_9GLOM|nr:3399_t:CDS:2 [Ambispora gerdemannii]